MPFDLKTIETIIEKSGLTNSYALTHEAYKEAFKTAINLIRTTPATPDELISCFRAMATDQKRYPVRTSLPILLLASHPDWDKNWILGAISYEEKQFNIEPKASTRSIRKLFGYRIIQNTINMEIVNAYLDWADETSKLDRYLFTNYELLDTETLHRAFNEKYYHVPRDPRVTAEMLTAYWSRLQENQDRWNIHQFLHHAVHNPNITPELLHEAASIRVYGERYHILENPNLTARSIQEVSNNFGKHILPRRLIAQHPNTPLSVIRRYARSAVPEVAEIAGQRLQQHQQKQTLRQTNRF